MANSLVLLVGEQGAEIYDPATGQWRPTLNPLGIPRVIHAAALLHDGKVLIAQLGQGAYFCHLLASWVGIIFEPLLNERRFAGWA